MTIKRISLHLGIIDSDYIREIIPVSIPIVWIFEKVENVAQMLLLLLYSSITHMLLVPFVISSNSDCLMMTIFGSTKPVVSFIAKLKIAEHPMLTLNIDENKFKGMFDMDAKVSVIYLQ